MRKLLIGTMLAVIFTVMSCEIPQSITIKGNPGLYIPLGRLSSMFGEGESITDFVSTAKIREMMGSTGFNIYDYRGDDVDSKVQAFLIHYPITEMTLDLSEYINEAMENADKDFSYTIPNLGDLHPEFAGNLQALFQSPAGPFQNGCFIVNNDNIAELSGTEGNPLFTIPLGDMATLLKSVKGGAGAFGLKLEGGYDPSFENVLQIKIPALGITDYIPGEKSGNTLVFANADDVTFYPQQLEDIKIYVKFDAHCSGTIAPKVIIDWKEAVIDTSEIGGISGYYPIDLGLGNFLGSGAQFSDNAVKGYIYVGGIDNNPASLTLKLDGAAISGVSEASLTEAERPSFSEPFTAAIPAHSLTAPYINLNSVLGANSLEYEISIDEMTLNADDVDEGTVIFADLVILLTLEFKIENDSSSDALGDYVKLDFGNVFPEPEDGKDIFMREGKDDDLFNKIDWVEIALSKIENNIFEMDKLSILVANTGSEPYSKRIDFSEQNPSLSIDMDELPNPFSPKFEILLEKDNGENYATLKIKRNDAPLFDFFLTVRAKATINETISLL